MVHRFFAKFTAAFSNSDSEHPLTFAHVAEAHGLAFIREANSEKDDRKKAFLYNEARTHLRKAMGVLMACLTNSTDRADHEILERLRTIFSDYRPVENKKGGRCDRFRLQRVLRYLGSALGASHSLGSIQQGLDLLKCAQSVVEEGIALKKFHVIYRAKVNSFLGKVYMYLHLAECKKMINCSSNSIEVADANMRQDASHLCMASDCLRSAVDLDRQYLGPFHPLMASPMHYYGRVLCMLGELKAGTEQLEEAWKVMEPSCNKTKKNSETSPAF